VRLHLFRQLPIEPPAPHEGQDFAKRFHGIALITFPSSIDGIMPDPGNSVKDYG
jgi:hypothetical protein